MTGQSKMASGHVRTWSDYCLSDNTVLRLTKLTADTLSLRIYVEDFRPLVIVNTLSTVADNSTQAYGIFPKTNTMFLRSACSAKKNLIFHSVKV